MHLFLQLLIIFIQSNSLFSHKVHFMSFDLQKFIRIILSLPSHSISPPPPQHPPPFPKVRALRKLTNELKEWMVGGFFLSVDPINVLVNFPSSENRIGGRKNECWARTLPIHTFIHFSISHKRNIKIINLLLFYVSLR